MTENKRAFFDQLAPEWAARGFPADEWDKVQRLKRRLGDLTGQTVFEPGCGAGRLTVLLSRWVGSDGRIFADDHSAEMVRNATDAATGLKNVRIIHEEAEHTTLPDGSVDLALLFCVYPHFNDPIAAFTRFRRLLKSNGRLIISHLEGSERLNAFHGQAGEPVKNDRIPPHPVIASQLDAAGMKLVELIDRDEEFFLLAVPV